MLLCDARDSKPSEDAMKALVGDKWVDGFLDYHRESGNHRIRVLAYLTLGSVEDLYFVRTMNVRLVWNYLREIGFSYVIRKIASRHSERFRNDKFLCVGIGWILHPGHEPGQRRGQLVQFIAPAHPKCVERLVLPQPMVREIKTPLPFDISETEILYAGSTSSCPAPLQQLRGWSVFSGVPLPELEPAFNSALSMLMEPATWANAQRFPIEEYSLPAERRPRRSSRVKSLRKQGVLFGYGNYAKTVLLPNIVPYVDIVCIHEVDPLQIPIGENVKFTWDTAQDIRTEEQYDAYFLAGFHHSHAPLAIKAMVSGSCAVVEKPLAVDSTQLSELLDIMTCSKGSLFSCFHKRYQSLNQYAFSDLGLRSGEPVSYHCIVYEVPLPRRHWYRWPNSKSRLVSNGCHWIDHFLFLNNFPDVRSTDLCVASEGTINCSVELSNGAFFTMVLTDQGSERIGVQDYIELRANGVSVRMVNGALYEAESKDRILRKARVNKMDCYRRMYRSIGQKIAQGLPGDTIESVRISTSTILKLEQQLASIIETQFHGSGDAHSSSLILVQ